MSSDHHLLFDISPLEGEGQRKKRGRKAVQSSSSPPVLAEEPANEPPPVGFLASLDTVPCWQCGAPADLADILIADGRKSWRVMCGWGCGVGWIIDPIPGVLDEKPKTEFVVREGRYRGKTFDEIDAMGERRYIESVAKLSTDKRAKAAAQAWLKEKTA